MSRYSNSITDKLSNKYDLRWSRSPIEIGRWLDSMEDVQFEDGKGKEHTCYMWNHIGPMMQLVLLCQFAMLTEDEVEQLRGEMSDAAYQAALRESKTAELYRAFYNEKTVESILAAERAAEPDKDPEDIPYVRMFKGMGNAIMPMTHNLRAFIGWMSIRLEEGRNQEEIVTSLLDFSIARRAAAG